MSPATPSWPQSIWDILECRLGWESIFGGKCFERLQRRFFLICPRLLKVKLWPSLLWKRKGATGLVNLKMLVCEMNSSEMNHQLAELFCMSLKSVRCFLTPVCTWNEATSDAKPYGYATSGGLWSSTTTPSLAPPKPFLGASTPTRYFTMHNVPTFRAGRNRSV